MFGWSIPLSDDSGERAGEGFQIEECRRQAVLGGVALPLGFQMKRYTPLSLRAVVRTEKEAEELAKNRLAEQEATLLADTEILDRAVSVSVNDRTVTLTGTYRCVEDIALEVPLNLGPSDPVSP